MEYLDEILLCAVAAAAIVCVMIIVFASITVLSLKNVRLEPLDEPESRRWLSHLIQNNYIDAIWAAEHGFEPVGAYRAILQPASPIVVAWTRRDEPTYLCAYIYDSAQNRTEVDIVTVAGDQALTTGTTRDAHLLPEPPGSWSQSFSLPDLESRWQRHNEARAYLAAAAGFDPSRHQPHLTTHFTQAIRDQADYIQSIALWPLRIPYWYFVRRHLRHGKSVEKLYDF